MIVITPVQDNVIKKRFPCTGCKADVFVALAINKKGEDKTNYGHQLLSDVNDIKCKECKRWSTEGQTCRYCNGRYRGRKRMYCSDFCMIEYTKVKDHFGKCRTCECPIDYSVWKKTPKPYRQHIYCSYECAVNHYANQCIVCNKKFVSRNRRTFCSQHCWKARTTHRQVGAKWLLEHLQKKETALARILPENVKIICGSTTIVKGNIKKENHWQHRLGTAGEYMFDAFCCLQNLDVLRPDSSTLPYIDRVIYSNKKTYTVQIKSTHERPPALSADESPKPDPFIRMPTVIKKAIEHADKNLDFVAVINAATSEVILIGCSEHSKSLKISCE